MRQNVERICSTCSCQRPLAPNRVEGEPFTALFGTAASFTGARWRTTGGRMRKLKLNLESLAIESFAIETTDARPRGTVAGHLVPAETYDCGYTEGECHGGSGGADLRADLRLHLRVRPVWARLHHLQLRRRLLTAAAARTREGLASTIDAGPSSIRGAPAPSPLPHSGPMPRSASVAATPSARDWRRRSDGSPCVAAGRAPPAEPPIRPSRRGGAGLPRTFRRRPRGGAGRYWFHPPARRTRWRPSSRRPPWR